MGFCGTIRDRHSGEFLTLALHTIVMYDPLIRIEDARYEMREGRKRQRRPRPEDSPKQLKMFPLTEEQAKDFESFGRTLRYFLESYQEEVTKTRPRSKDKLFGPDGRLHNLEYCSYEFYKFWYGFITTVGVKKFEEQVNRIEQIGQNTNLDDFEPTIKFLSHINSRALAEHNYHRGGCF